MLKSDARRWGSLAKVFHWLIVGLILAQVVIGVVMVNLPLRPSVIPVFNLHKSIGLTVLALAVLRLTWRAFDPHPQRPADVSALHYRLGRAMHVLLYLLIFLVPLSGWLFDSAEALRPLRWWGLIGMPSLTGGPMPDWADATRRLHQWLVWTLVVAASMHMLAALVHHVFYRDEILRRMLPWGKPRTHEPTP